MRAKTKNAVVRRFIQSVSGEWTAAVRPDGEKTEVSIYFGVVEPREGQRIKITGSGNKWEMVA